MRPTPRQHLALLAALCGILLFSSYEDSREHALASDVPAPIPIFEETELPSSPPVSAGAYEYIYITNSCDSEFNGNCIKAYAGPGTEYKVMHELRNGMLLRVRSRAQENGVVWYRVYFDEWLRYPERLEGPWFVPAVAGTIVKAGGVETGRPSATTSKRIIVDLSDHMIYAYDGSEHFMTTKVSTGIEFTPTPTGTFTIYKKMPTRYMQGPLPGVSDVPFDLPGVPWNLYFTQGGAVIHGSYWHDRYGTEQSSGCVNLPPELAKILYDWADLGTTVVIQD